MRLHFVLREDVRMRPPTEKKTSSFHNKRRDFRPPRSKVKVALFPHWRQFFCCNDGQRSCEIGIKAFMGPIFIVLFAFTSAETGDECCVIWALVNNLLSNLPKSTLLFWRNSPPFSGLSTVNTCRLDLPGRSWQERAAMRVRESSWTGWRLHTHTQGLVRAQWHTHS